MFEKIPKIESEKKQRQRMVELGSKTVDRELNIKNPSKSKALVLATFLALLGAGEAKAVNWESMILGPRGIKGTVVGEVTKAVDQGDRNKRQEIDQEFSNRRDEISQNIQALEANYQQERAEHQRAGDQQKMAELERNYKKEREALIKLQIANEKHYRSELTKLEIKEEAKKRTKIAIRGW